MTQQLLDRVMKRSAEGQREFEQLAGDWRGQIGLYQKVVRYVTKLQARMCAVFGTPDVVPAKAQSTLQGPRPSTGVFYRWQDGVVDAAEMEGVFVKFRGACVVQTQSVEQLEEEAVVRYRAALKVDENYFLERMLPSTKSLQVHDPEYPLYAFDIRVPRGELVRESLHALSSAMRSRRKKSAPPIPLSEQRFSPATQTAATSLFITTPAGNPPWTIMAQPTTFATVATTASATNTFG